MLCIAFILDKLQSMLFLVKINIHDKIIHSQMTSLGIAPALNGDMDGETVIGVTDTLTVRASQIRSEVSICNLLYVCV